MREALNLFQQEQINLQLSDSIENFRNAHEPEYFRFLISAVCRFIPLFSHPVYIISI